MSESLVFLILLISFSLVAKEVKYELVIENREVEIGGKIHKKFTVNGGIPAPILRFTNGDYAKINVINKTNDKTLIHWHGLLIPNDQDGVPYINSLPIEPNSSKLYEFPIIQSGTYWYHSHVMFQEQDGIYGAFIIDEKNTKYSQSEETVILSDFSHESGEQIHRNLKKDGEYYAIKKGFVQSWLKSLKTGTFWTKMKNSLQRMEGMDYADIGYDHFLANGEPLTRIPYKDKKIKLRVINGSASSIFKLTYANGPITIIGNDGTYIEPVDVDILRVSVAETYDILLDADNENAYELRATSIDNSGFSSTIIGNQEEYKKAPKMPWVNPMSMDMGHMMGMMDMGFFSGLAMNYRNEFLDVPRKLKAVESEYSLPKNESSMKNMSHGMHMGHSGSKKMKMGSKMKEYDYSMAKAKTAFKVKENQKLLTYNFTLNGNMENYVWTINGSPLGPESYIKIKKGYRVRFVMKNTTMMNHPMHLHGHFFRVLNKNGFYSPKKHTVNVDPLSTVTFEFEANEEKDWFFHCHVLYHMMDGMARIIRYEDNPGPKDIEEARIDSHEFNYYKKPFLSTKALFQSNFSRVEGKVFNTKYMLEYALVSDYKDGNSEGEIHIARTLTRYLSLYAGVKTESEEDWDLDTSATVGLTWTLPLNIAIDIKYQPDLEEKYEIELENSIQLTDRLQLNLAYTSTRNWMTEFEYRPNKRFSFAVNYNKEYDTYGAGLGFTY